MAAALWRSFARRKPLPSDSQPTNSSGSLARVLTTWDLTALGVGSTLGVGVYVLAGDVARRQAGPAVLLSFVVAGIASGLAGLCYSEFGARVPLAGSAYVYSYVSVGELIAFVIGWSLVLEYAIGSASVARALTSYVDQLTGNYLERTFQNLLPMNVPILASYADPVSFAAAFGLSVILAFGVRESLSLNNVFAGLNMAVITFVVVAGCFKADFKNWNIAPRNAPSNAHVGEGGFMPFGISGVLRGAATCFYGFVGFDCIAASGEEVRRPQRAIPIAILGSLVIVCVSYLAVSAVLTLMWPYYDLKNDGAPLATVFRQVGWPIAQWIVAIGGVFGLMTSLFGTMFPLPRVIYAMATDGLLFRFLGNVHSRYQTPFIGTLLSGLLTGIMAAIFHLQQLVDMLSIGTLMAYTLVAICVLLLRYRTSEDNEASALLHDRTSLKTSTWEVLKQLFNSQGFRSPTNLTGSIVTVLILLYCVFSVILALLFVHNERDFIPLGAVASVMTSILILITLQPSTTKSIPFKVPLVPILPALSISMNIYLMLLLDRPTWIRFSVWMVMGCFLWVVYIACRCCFPAEVVPNKDSTYVNTGFDGNLEEPLRENGGVNHNPTGNSAVEFRIGDVKTEIPIRSSITPCDEQNHVIDENKLNRFVRATSVVEGEVLMERVSDLTVKEDNQTEDITETKGRFVRATSVQECHLSFEYALESDLLSIDSDAHSLYPEVLICLPTEEATKQQNVIEEESDSEDEDRDTESELQRDSSSPESQTDRTKSGGLSDSTHVESEDETCESVTDGVSDLNDSESESTCKSFSDQDESLLEADGQAPPVWVVTTQPDSDPVMESSSDEELSHVAREIGPKLHFKETLPSFSKTKFSNENAKTDSGLDDKDLCRVEESVDASVQDVNKESIANDEDELPSTIIINNVFSTANENTVPSNSNQSTRPESPRTNRISLSNFSISSFDNKPIDSDTRARKKNMAAGSFSDLNFIERLNDVIGRRSVSVSSLGLKQEPSLRRRKEVQNINDLEDDDVFIPVPAEAVPSKELLRERLESILSNSASRNARLDSESRPRSDVAKELRTVKVKEQSETVEVGDLNPETSFVEKLNSIMKRRTGSLPPMKRKEKGEVLLAGGNTLPERRGSKGKGVDDSDPSEDVPPKKDIRRKLELLFLNDPKRRANQVEEISTVL